MYDHTPTEHQRLLEGVPAGMDYDSRTSPYITLRHCFLHEGAPWTLVRPPASLRLPILALQLPTHSLECLRTPMSLYCRKAQDMELVSATRSRKVVRLLTALTFSYRYCLITSIIFASSEVFSIGIGLFFSAFMIVLTAIQARYTGFSPKNSEEFNSASRSVKPGLIASGIVSAWTWAATLVRTPTFPLNIKSVYLSVAASCNQVQWPTNLASRVLGGMVLEPQYRSSCSLR